VPEEFNFCQSKKDIYLNTHMDAANRPEEKLKAMSFAAKRYKKEIESLKQPAVNPPSTLKTEAALLKRRQELEFKLYQEQMKA
jgi:hypothetical protein